MTTHSNRYRLTFLIFIVFICCSPEKTLEKKESMDGIEIIPEWLKLNVGEALPLGGLNIWIPTNNFQTSSLIRVPRFPRKFLAKEIGENQSLKDFQIIPLKQGKLLDLKTVINEQTSAQIAISAKQNLHNVKIKVGNLVASDGEILSADNIRVRYVKYVPVQRSRSEYVWSPKLESIVGEGTSGNMNPNVVGDPLIDLKSVDIPAYRTQPVWFTFRVPKTTKSGVYQGTLDIFSDEYKKVSHKIRLTILNQILPDPVDYKFHLDLWINPSAIAEYYKLEYWSEEHWNLISKYLKDYASRGGKNIATTITHEPWHKPWINKTTRPQTAFGYRSMVKWYKNTNGNWEFDYSIFDKYVTMATKLGIHGAINTFSMTPFHSKQRIHYLDREDNVEKVIEIDINDLAYKKIWTYFLISFKKHLIRIGLFERTYLGFDEKPEESLKILYKIIENAAPEFIDRIMIAGHPEVGERAKNLSISYMFFPNQALEKNAVVPVLPTIEDRKNNRKLTTFYLCAEPDHPNTLTYSPAVEAQLIPWLALKYNTDGYLRWAYNNWTKDPFKCPVFIHNQGDDYYVYPGKDGPISSIRWELLKEGIEDYELYRIIKEQGNISNNSLQKAVELATRNQDGRVKKVSDILDARKMILE